MNINAQLNELAATAFTPEEDEPTEQAQPVVDTDEDDLDNEEVIEEEDSEELASEDEDEDEDLEFFNQLPEAIGLETEEFYNLKLKLDNGEALTLSEMKDKLQSEKTRLEELQQRETALREREQTLASAVPPNVVSEEVQQAQGQLYAIQAAWTGLQQQQQQAEAAGDTDSLTRVNNDMLKLQQMYGGAQQALQTAQGKAEQQQQQYMQSFMNEQKQALQKAAPDWNGETTQAVMQYLSDNVRLSQDELNQAYDHRFWILANKARQWDEHTAKLSQARETVKKGKLRAIPGRKGKSKLTSKKQTAAIDSAIKRAQKNPHEINGALNALAKGMIDGNI